MILDRLNKMKFENNLSIVFTGYNIKDYISLAINSLLHFHPEYKNKIIVFDDNSNDGTKEWLDKSGIRRITWSKEYDLSNTSETGYRVSCIYKEIFDQCKTRYLMINDGDIVFYGKIKHNYADLIQEYPLLFDIIEIPNGMPSSSKKFKYKKYLYNGEYFTRSYPCHMIFDMEYLRKNNIYEFDDITEDWKKDCQILDLGADFLYKVYLNELKYKIIYFDDYIYHFGFVSSIERLLLDYPEDLHSYVLEREDEYIRFFYDKINKCVDLDIIMNIYGKSVLKKFEKTRS